MDDRTRYKNFILKFTCEEAKTMATKAKASKTATKAASKAKPAAKKSAAAKSKPATKAAAPKAKAKAGDMGDGTKENPWKLTTPSGTSDYMMYMDDTSDPPSIVCVVGSTTLRYDKRALNDLHSMLKQHGDWMPLGSADEQKPAAEGTVEAWGRSASNPIGGWYGLKKGLRGRFGMYIPPLMERLGLAEVEHNPKNNRMRAV